MYKKDLFRYGYSGKIGLLKALFIPGFKYLFFFRAFKSSPKAFKPFFKIIIRFLSRWYGIQIELNTSIGKGFYIGHFGNIIVNGETIIGENCNISQCVTLGATNRGSKKGAPTIGNKVWIGANAVIVGKIRIGDNVLIAPNTFINFNIPSNSIVSGNPAVVNQNLKATEHYINNKI